MRCDYANCGVKIYNDIATHASGENFCSDVCLYHAHPLCAWCRDSEDLAVGIVFTGVNVCSICWSEIHCAANDAQDPQQNECLALIGFLADTREARLLDAHMLVLSALEAKGPRHAERFLRQAAATRFTEDFNRALARLSSGLAA